MGKWIILRTALKGEAQMLPDTSGEGVKFLEANEAS